MTEYSHKPWDFSLASGLAVIKDVNGKVVAHVPCENQEQMANTWLIVSAPEMHHLLVRLSIVLEAYMKDAGDNFEPTLDEVTQLLIKIRGLGPAAIERAKNDL